MGKSRRKYSREFKLEPVVEIGDAAALSSAGAGQPWMEIPADAFRRLGRPHDAPPELSPHGADAPMLRRMESRCRR